MKQALLLIQRRLFIVTLISFALTPIIGYATASFFNMAELQSLFTGNSGIVLIAMYGSLLFWCAIHFKKFLQPIINWKLRHPDNNFLPEDLNSHLQCFSNRYWMFFLLYVLTVPTVHHWFLQASEQTVSVSSMLQFMLLQLTITILVGLPGYLDGLSTLGKLTRFTGLSNVQVSLRTKMLLVGAYIPLLTTSILLKYYWWQTGFISLEVVLAWALMGLTAVISTMVAYRSLTQSLIPVEMVTANSGATSHADLAKQLQPQSNDEIGFLVQTLNRLFYRLGEQDEYVQAIVEHAAEAMIVINEEQHIEMFNPAAENLFGYSSHEIGHRNLSWLLPNISLPKENRKKKIIRQEIEAIHRDGHKLILSMHISHMQMNNKLYYILLVGDVTERKATETMLLEAEERYRNLVVTAHDLVWSMDNKGRWTYLNKAVTDIYGYQADEMLFKHYSDYQIPESRDRDLSALETILSGKEIVGYETVHINKQGEQIHISFNAKPTKNPDGSVAYITGTARDITSKKAYENELTYQAQHDSLTGIYNRKYFQQELERVVSRVARSAADCAVFYMDLDQFKYVNDTVGHGAGDKLLLETTELLRSHIREGDLLARFGGDEFTVLLYNLDREEACTVAEGIRKLFENYQFLDSGKSFNVTLTLGIACITNQTKSADEVLSQADIACNIAKSNGRNRIHIAEPGNNEKDGLANDMGWATRVRDAFENDNFSLLYQPIISVANGSINDYEVLLRMHRENGDVILPGGFMPAAERFGLVHNVDRWVVTNALTHLDSLTTQFNSDLRFAINLSGRAFEDKQLLPLIQGLIDDSQLSPSQLTFEITETAAIANLKDASKFISKLKDLGCEFALDDFGSGFCSFSYLKKLPVDKLKIDGSFVKSMAESQVDQAMVQSMNQIAQALGKKTIAEFVENNETLQLLKSYGVDFAQGNYLGIPTAQINSSMDFQNIPSQKDSDLIVLN